MRQLRVRVPQKTSRRRTFVVVTTLLDAKAFPKSAIAELYRQRWHAELDQVLAGRQPTAADYPQLPYTEMVFAEAMRLYPPAWIIGRRALSDYEIAGYHVPAGAILLMSQYITHHDARWFTEPEAFQPARWTPEAKEARPKFSYYPFGGGNRLCIGEQFAWMEGVLVMATIGQHWRMRLVEPTPVELKVSVTLRPQGGLPMRVERR